MAHRQVTQVHINDGLNHKDADCPQTRKKWHQPKKRRQSATNRQIYNCKYSNKSNFHSIQAYNEHLFISWML